MTGSEKGWLPSGACALFVCDVVSYGDPRRTDLAQAYIREKLYGLLERSFGQAGIPYSGIYEEDRGDGVMLVVPLEYDPALLVTIVVERLRADLGRHNELSSEAARIRLRLSVHLGIAVHDGKGLVGVEVNHVFRLLEAPLFKKLMKDTGATVGLIVSERFHDEVVRRDTGLISADDYLHMPVAVKETECTGWVRIFGGPVPAVPETRELQPREETRPEPRPETREERAAGPQPAFATVEADPLTIFALVDRTLEIPAMLTERGREQVVGALPPAIAVVIPRSYDARSDMYQIIRTCLDYTGGLQCFLQAIRLFVGDSMAVTRLEQTIAQLLTRL